MQTPLCNKISFDSDNFEMLGQVWALRPQNFSKLSESNKILTQWKLLSCIKKMKKNEKWKILPRKLNLSWLGTQWPLGTRSHWHSVARHSVTLPLGRLGTRSLGTQSPNSFQYDCLPIQHVHPLHARHPISKVMDIKDQFHYFDTICAVYNPLKDINILSGC
jgi:hypothetical protein